MILTPEGKFLLFLSHFDPGSELPPQWVFPGGGLEADEEPLQGIVREVFEETGRLFLEADFESFGSIHHAMEDLRRLVVVRQDDGVLLDGQRADLGLQGGDRLG